ncbi:MAG: 30S ribosomal protein S6 [bacterium]|nr:30S ribosomal protein S6 [bacterium]
MPRTYELGFIVEPRQSDDDVKTIATKYRQMIEASGATITEEDHWGKRKLAYPIHKFTEGQYVFLFVSADGSVPWPDVERLLMQDEKILRHLVVRTDRDLKREASKGKKKSPRNRPAQGEAEAIA